MVFTVAADADLARLGFLIADRTRAAFLLTLLNGGLTSASALAERAGVSRSLASAHLRRLTEGGLIVAEPRGRQRLYRLAGQGIADALEVLVQSAPPGDVRSLRDATENDQLRRARLCYDHFAGRLGVALRDALCARGLLSHEGQVTATGEAAFAALEIDVAALGTHGRPLTRACLDWSEGRPHLAGGLGAALTTEILRRGWVRTREASRVVTVTPAGERALREHFGLIVDDGRCTAPAAA
jgi:DNA-binding transcriptional ArsR family regulator